MLVLEEEEEEEEEFRSQIKASVELSHDCLGGSGLCCTVCLYMQSVKADNKRDRGIQLSDWTCIQPDVIILGSYVLSILSGYCKLGFENRFGSV